jgi:cytochrome c-type biogenesis protein CcmH/NrfG
MKPKVLCSHCNAILSLGSQTCPSCGTAVEWSGAGAPAERPAQPARKEKKSARPSSKNEIPWTGIVIGAVAIGVFLYAILTENRPTTVQAPAIGTQAPVQTAPSGPNMAMVQQIQALQAEVNAQPKNAQKLLELANVQHDARFFDNAVSSYRAYLKLSPTDANGRVDLGICLHELGKDDDAIQEMKRALKDDPKHVQAHYNLGIVYLTLGNMTEANEWFKKTAALAPNSEMGQRAQQMVSQHNPQQIR